MTGFASWLSQDLHAFAAAGVVGSDEESVVPEKVKSSYMVDDWRYVEELDGAATMKKTGGRRTTKVVKHNKGSVLFITTRTVCICRSEAAKMTKASLAN